MQGEKKFWFDEKHPGIIFFRKAERPVIFRKTFGLSVEVLKEALEEYDGREVLEQEKPSVSFEEILVAYKIGRITLDEAAYILKRTPYAQATPKEEKPYIPIAECPRCNFYFIAKHDMPKPSKEEPVYCNRADHPRTAHICHSPKEKDCNHDWMSKDQYQRCLKCGKYRLVDLSYI